MAQELEGNANTESPVSDAAAASGESADDGLTFAELIEQTKAEVFAADAEEGDDDAETDEAEAEPEEGKAEEESEESEKTESEDTKEPEEKTEKRRSLSYKELRNDRDELQAKIDELNQKLDEVGGIEGFQFAQQTVEAFMDPTKLNEQMEFIQTLPHGQRLGALLATEALGLVGDVPEDKLGEIVANQTHVFNRSLQQFQGLQSELSPETIEKLGRWIAVRANDSAEDLAEYIERDLAFYDDDVPASKRPEAKQPDQNAAPAAEPQVSEADFLLGLQQKFDKYEKGVGTLAVGDVLLDNKVKFDPRTAPPELIEAVSVLNEILFNDQSVSMREKKAFSSVAEYLAAEKDGTPAFKTVEANYKRAIKLHVADRYKKLAPLLNLINDPASVKTSAPTEQLGARESIAVPNGAKGPQSLADLIDASRPR